MPYSIELKSNGSVQRADAVKSLYYKWHISKLLRFFLFHSLIVKGKLEDELKEFQYAIREEF